MLVILIIYKIIQLKITNNHHHNHYKTTLRLTGLSTCLQLSEKALLLIGKQKMEFSVKEEKAEEYELILPSVDVASCPGGPSTEFIAVKEEGTVGSTSFS